MTVKTHHRKLPLADLVAELEFQQALKHDVVVPAHAILSNHGVLRVIGLEGAYQPTEIMDGHLADKLKIPTAYLRRLRADRPDLYDANVNGWLRGGSIFDDTEPGEYLRQFGPDSRKFFLRTLSDPAGDTGIARALLSDTYKRIDHLDVAVAVLGGITDSGQVAEVLDADLTESRMTLRIASPTLAVAAPALLANYRGRGDGHGWTIPQARSAARREGLGYPEGGEPVVFAGFDVTNSETGGGAFTITPRLLVQICKNGLCIPVDADRTRHLGGKMDEGAIRWSDETQRKNLELVQLRARDAVTTFMSKEYVEEVVARLTTQAATELADPAATIEHVGQELNYSDDTRRGVLDLFIKGGQVTAGGVMQAITAFAQEVASADLAYELEHSAVKALAIAAS